MNIAFSPGTLKVGIVPSTPVRSMRKLWKCLNTLKDLRERMALMARIACNAARPSAPKINGAIQSKKTPKSQTITVSSKLEME